MRIVITGGAGFLGYHLAPICAANGATPVIVDVAHADPADYPAGTEFHVGDVRDPGVVARVLRGARRRRRAGARRRPRGGGAAPLVAGGHPQHQRRRDAHRPPGGARGGRAADRVRLLDRGLRRPGEAPPGGGRPARRRRRLRGEQDRRRAGLHRVPGEGLLRPRAAPQDVPRHRTPGRLPDPLRLGARRQAHPHPRLGPQPLPAARSGRPLRRHLGGGDGAPGAGQLHLQRRGDAVRLRRRGRRRPLRPRRLRRAPLPRPRRPGQARPARARGGAPLPPLPLGLRHGGQGLRTSHPTASRKCSAGARATATRRP